MTVHHEPDPAPVGAPPADSAPPAAQASQTLRAHAPLRPWLRTTAVALALVGAVVAIYGSSHWHEFTNFDDDLYVSQNPHLTHGLTRDNIRWAFTNYYAANWHPLTWLSHQLDVNMYGLWAGGHHWTNILLHAAATLLLWAALTAMTRAFWRSAIVAALFAVHPLHVESVAWVAERKDVLSGFFAMLTLLAYAWYVRKPGLLGYLLTSLCLALGLLAKPMLITWPMVLLLLDYWPLQRMHAGLGCPPRTFSWSRAWRVALEKLPWLLMAGVSSYLTLQAQRNWGAVKPLDHVGLMERLTNASVAYAWYLLKMIWPSDLAVFYPHPGHWRWTIILAAALTLAGITLIVLALARRRAYLVVGWLWYLGTLVPVIGLVQVGDQSYADRYTYLPLLGVFIMVVWGLTELFDPSARDQPDRAAAAPEFPLRLWLGRLATLALLLVLAGVARHQVGFWRDSFALWKRNLAVTGQRNWIAHNNLGAAYSITSRANLAEQHYRMAVEANPQYIVARNNLGMVLLGQQKYDQAIAAFEESIQANPYVASSYQHLAATLEHVGRHAQAIENYRKSADLTTEGNAARLALAELLLKEGRSQEAATEYQRAIQDDPRSGTSHARLGDLLLADHKPEMAQAHYEAALRLDEHDAQAHGGLGQALAQQGQFTPALEHLRQALDLEPQNQPWRLELGRALALSGDLPAAVETFHAALRLHPQWPEAHNELGLSLLKLNQVDQAIEQFQAAVDLRPGYMPAQDNLRQARRLKSGVTSPALPPLGGTFDDMLR